MRKIIMLNRVSIDGYFAGPQGELDWFEHEQEVGDEWHNIEEGADTILFGGTTYRVFEDFWSKFRNQPNPPKEMKAVADELDQMNKVVFSRTLKEVGWENSRLLRGNLFGEVKKLKKERGGNILIFGSGSIVQQLANGRLIDEYVITVMPVGLGTGKPLFENTKKFNLDLLKTVEFKSGTLLIHYRIKEKS